jgi:hypothetical protein
MRKRHSTPQNSTPSDFEESHSGSRYGLPYNAPSPLSLAFVRPVNALDVESTECAGRAIRHQLYIVEMRQSTAGAYPNGMGQRHKSRRAGVPSESNSHICIAAR